MIDFRQHLSSDDRAVAAAIERLAKEDAAAVPIFDRDACDALVAAGATMAFRRATPIVGAETRRVEQDFDLSLDFKDGSPFFAARDTIEAAVKAGLALLPPTLLDRPPEFNDLILQYYYPTAVGISPHRDHVKYVGLVALLVLNGRGRFLVCDDRAGAGAREIPSRPGDLILMRAPGYGDFTDRPFHMLRDIEVPRYSFGLRHDISVA